MKKAISALLVFIIVFALLPCTFAKEATAGAIFEDQSKYYVITLDAGEGIFLFTDVGLAKMNLDGSVSPDGKQLYVRYKEGETINIMGCVPNRENYYFQGWNSEPPQKMPAKDITFEAEWSDKPGQLISCVCIKYNQAKRGEKLNSNFTAMTDNIKLSYVTSWIDRDSNETVYEGKLVPDKADTLKTNLYIKAEKGFCFSGDTTVIFNDHSGMTSETHLKRLNEGDNVGVLKFEITQKVKDESDWIRVITFFPLDIANNLGQIICAKLGKNVFPGLLFTPLKKWRTEEIRY